MKFLLSQAKNTKSNNVNITNGADKYKKHNNIAVEVLLAMKVFSDLHENLIIADGMIEFKGLKSVMPHHLETTASYLLTAQIYLEKYICFLRVLLPTSL